MIDSKAQNPFWLANCFHTGSQPVVAVCSVVGSRIPFQLPTMTPGEEDTRFAMTPHMKTLGCGRYLVGVSRPSLSPRPKQPLWLSRLLVTWPALSFF